MGKVAVVIPAYNAESYIHDTLRSVLDSTYDNIVVVVVNDGSTDRTEAEAKRINDDRVVIINRVNQGMSASRNFGIDAFDSEFVALVDSDDIWHPRKIELQIACMRQDPDVGLCFTEFEKYYGGDVEAFAASPVNGELDERLSGYIYHKMLLTNWALPSSVLFRRSLWKEMGKFRCDDQQTDDWEYLVRASRSFKFAKLKSHLVLYRQPPTSLSRRVPKRNSTEEMRASLIDRFGLNSPQGDVVDTAELENRRYVGLINFYDLHVCRGDFRDGARGFLTLLVSHPNKAGTIVKFAKSLRRRVLGSMAGAR